MSALLQRLRDRTRDTEPTRRLGEVTRIAGQAIEARGPEVVLGEICRLVPRGRTGGATTAEVIGVRGGMVTLMAYGPVHGLSAGCEVQADGLVSTVGAGPALLGRVVDGFGRALDGLPDPVADVRQPLHAEPANPLRRPRIDTVIETGVRCIDALLTLGRGQRVGIFAGSGVGKSSLLGMVARHVRCDVNVVALIGERGREVREIVDKQLGADGLARSVVVVAAADQPAPARVRAALAATAIAESFRDRGLHVLLTMDSVTRYAMARREIGNAAGEPPTARGWTPSVHAEIPPLCERCGTHPGGGSITGLYTVLVEGDDHDEPIADLLRATLDGHIVLSRELAHRGQYPAIDLLRSVSRLLPDLAPLPVRELAGRVQRLLALLERNRPMVEIGAYTAGSNPALDRALALEPALQAFLRQPHGGVPRESALQQLAAWMPEAT